jgi:hypothetical protein
MTKNLPSFSQLRERYGPDGAATVATLISKAGEARRLIDYLRDLGQPIGALSDLMRGIRALEDEEELAAFECLEGVAVSHVSDGWWVLFVEPVEGKQPPAPAAGGDR